MSMGAARFATILLSGCLLWPLVAAGQGQQSPEDAALQQIKLLDPVGEADQARIADWIRLHLDRLSQVPQQEQREAAKQLRQRFRTEYEDSRNTAAFKTHFAAQSSRVGDQFLTAPSTPPLVAYAVARGLVDLKRPEALPGLLAGLKSSAPAARYLSARGIYDLHSTIGGDKEKLERTISSLRDAALAETDSVALAQMYRALGVSAQPAQVFDAYLSVLDKGSVDQAGLGAELEAYNFFRGANVMGGLSQAQKSQLAARLAVFLRMYVDRYANAKLKFAEIDRLERLMCAVEEMLETMAGAGSGGTIRKTLEEGGYQRRAELAAEAAKWIGDAQSNAAGVLNAAPWNVPVGGGAAGATARATGSTD